MDNNNPLKKYIGRSFKIIDEVSVKEGVSKDGAPYCYVELHFINGFTKRLYPNEGERFAFISAFDLAPTIDSLNSSF